MIQILVALVIFTLFALGGLIVDLGFVRLTQRQMATAADAAALEGMRLEDGAPDDVRRRASRNMLQAHYDDDFQVTAADRRSYGAGPVVRVTGGRTSWRANAQVEVEPGAVVFEPEMQLNLPNAPHGDLVAGRFDPTDRSHLESATYLRSDFDPSGVNAGWDAFLVRLRRTDGPSALDAQAGVSSRGPALPYLFGRGSLIDGQSREKGIAVRATSIAAGRRATLVGLPDHATGLTGTAPFLLELDFWNSLSPGTVVTLPFGQDNAVQGRRGGRGGGGPPDDNPYDDGRGSPPIIPPGQVRANEQEPVVGVIDHRRDEARRAWSIGDPVAPREDVVMEDLRQWLGADAEGVVDRLFYVPIYDADGELPWDGRPGRSSPPPFTIPVPDPVDKHQATTRVVGFGVVHVLAIEEPLEIGEGDGGGIGNGRGNGNGIGTGNGNAPRIVIETRGGYVAPLNASAVSTPGLTDLLAEGVLERLKLVNEPLRASALAR